MTEFPFSIFLEIYSGDLLAIPVPRTFAEAFRQAEILIA